MNKRPLNHVGDPLEAAYAIHTPVAESGYVMHGQYSLGLNMVPLEITPPNTRLLHSGFATEAGTSKTSKKVLLVFPKCFHKYISLQDFGFCFLFFVFTLLSLIHDWSGSDTFM